MDILNKLMIGLHLEVLGRILRHYILPIMLMTVLVACDYVANDNIYGLPEEDFTLLVESDSQSSYAFDYTAVLTTQGPDGAPVELDISGTGAYQQADDEIFPNFDLIATFSAPTVTSQIMQVRTVDGAFYLKLYAPTVEDPDTIPWQVIELGELLGLVGFSTPGSSSLLDESLLQSFGEVDDGALWNFSTITREPDVNVRSGTVEETVLARYLIETNFVDFILSESIRPALYASIAEEIGLDLDTLDDPSVLDADLEAYIASLFSTFTLNVEQYINLETRQQARSVTTLEWVISDPTGVTPSVPFSLLVDTTYRDFFEESVITAPAESNIIDPTAMAIPEETEETTPLPDSNPQNNLFVPDVREPVEIVADISPTEVTTQLCNQVCYNGTFDIVLPDGEAQALDVVVVIDITGSMEAELSGVQSALAGIINRLQRDISDARFAVVTYADHPQAGGNPGDVPYTLVADFSSNAAEIQQQIDSISLQHGGDTPESLLFALNEVSMLNWREEATRVVALFTDAPPIIPDPGSDQRAGTADDISDSTVLATLARRGIRAITIQSGGSSSARAFLTRLSNSTGGVSTQLTDASQITEVMVENIGLLITGDLALEPIGATFAYAEGDPRAQWLSFTPNSFEYPEGEIPVAVDARICPAVAELADGDYILNLELRDNRNSYGSAVVNFTYNRLCADLYIADTPTDDGLGCSDETPQTVFWESDDIVVLNRPTANPIEGESDIPLFGQENYVYVRVNNRGPEDATQATLTLYASDNPFAVDFPGSWQQIGQKRFSLAADAEIWEEFVWVPTGNVVALRAVISTAEDVVQFSNDFACDNNIAQLNRIYITLDVPSFEEGLLGQEVPFVLEAPQNISYRTLDMRVRGDQPPAGSIQLELDPIIIDNWQYTVQNAGRSIGGNRFLLTGSEMLFPSLVSGADVQITGRLVVISDESGSGSIPVSLGAADRTWLGASIIYTADNRVVPPGNAEEAGEQPEPVAYVEPTALIPAALSVVLFFVLLLAYAVRRRQAGG